MPDRSESSATDNYFISQGNFLTDVAKMKPYYFTMCDASLSSDNVTDNFEQIFKAYSKDTIRKIL